MNKLTKKLFSFLALTLVLSLSVSNFAPIAFAHQPILSGQVVCESSGTKKVNWTITNSESNKTMTIDEVNVYYEENDSTPDSHSSSLTDQIDGIEDDIVNANGSIQATNTLDEDDEEGYIKIKVRADFSGPGNDDIERELTLNLGDECQKGFASSINQQAISACGTQQLTFTGTSDFPSDDNSGSSRTQYRLRVTLDGNEIYLKDSDGNWSTPSQNIGVGNHTVASAVQKRTSTNSGSTWTNWSNVANSNGSFNFTVNACVTDVCTNIPEVQASLPNGYYFASAGICVPQTPVCTDDSATNYDNNVTANEKSDNSVCQYPEETPTDVCPEEGIQTDPEACEEEEDPTPTIPACEEGHQAVLENGIYICIECDGSGTCEVGENPNDDVTPTPTETPTPTPTDTPSNNNNNNSSSNNSSGGTGGPSVQASVLGATTMANTGNFVETLANTALTFGLMLVSLSGLGYAGKNVKKTK